MKPAEGHTENSLHLKGQMVQQMIQTIPLPDLAKINDKTEFQEIKLKVYIHRIWLKIKFL